MSSTSNASLSGSSAAANTVVVTARDIEFSNYNSSTGKWGNAVMTMMIEDANTPDNVNLEVYNEKVYAVFRNHYDHSDTVRTSAEVDGMDFRVTISTPMVASGKYELYKVYGETSGREYATTSQFYFQVPGKVWDFANDIVDHDVELVSDWWNYGCFTDMNDVVHGFTASTEAQLALGSSGNRPFVVDGVTYDRNADIKKLKISSYMQGDMRKIGSSSLYGGGLHKIESLDIVSSGITYLPGEFMKSYSSLFDQKFALPSTLEETPYAGWAGLSRFNKPFWIPDNVTMINSQFFRMSGMFNGKIHWPENSNGITIGSEVIAAPSMNYNQPIVWPSKVKSIGTYFLYYCAYNKDFAWPLTTDTTAIPNYTCYQWRKGNNTDNITITIPSGITSIGQGCFYNIDLVKKIIVPNTVTTIGNGSFGWININSRNQVQSLEISFPSSITSVGNDFLNKIYGQNVTLGLPSNVVTIGYNFLSDLSSYDLNITNWGWDSTDKCLTIPSTVTSIGSGFMKSSIAESRIKKVVVPESVTSIGTGFCSEMASGNQRTDTWNTLEVDFSKVDPSVFADNDTSTFRMYHPNGSTQWYAYKIKATIAPGTEEDWKAKLPNIQDTNTGYYLRYIEWVEKPTSYGYVFYIESNGGQEKYVELQSQAEFDSLVFTTYGQTATVGEDQIVLKNSGYPNMITGISVGTDITSIPDNFCQYCRITKFILQPSTNTVTIGNTVGRVAGWDGNHVATINLNNRVTTIGNNFFNQHHYVQAVKGFGSVTSVGSSFLVYNNINTTIDDTSGLTSIGSTFLSNSPQFNNPIDVSNVTQMPTSFLENCSTFNQPLDFSGVQFAGASNVLAGCTSFNSPITMPTALSPSATSQQRTLTGFLMNATSFNQPIDFSVFEDANNISVLGGCTSFNSQITMPSRVRQGDFLKNAESFNQPITLPDFTESSGIYSSLCQNWKSFNQPVTIPTGWCRLRWYNNATLFEGCDSLTSTVTFSSTTVPDGTYSASAIQKSFSTTDETAAAYTTGVTFTGTGAQAWKNALPDSTTSPYRKINVA